MRLSAHVNQHGIDAFTFDDFIYVGRKVAQAAEPMILVGGQALETWGVVFDVLAPTGDRHPLTEDADWLGGKRDAAWLCDKLGRQHTELQVAGDFDNTPSAAIAFLERPDRRVLMMDFLRAIVGPTNDEVRRLAVPVRIADGVVVHVLHPLLCLESRMANLALLPSKRTGNGPMQAQWATDIAGAYVGRLDVSGPAAKRQAIKACHAVAELAEYKHGRYCWLNYRLDPLRAVTPAVVTAIGGRFAADDWPRTEGRVAMKRKRWEAMAHGRSDPGTEAPGREPV